MEYIQENERTLKKDEGGINLRDVVELIIANWYWFVLSVLVCVGAAYFYVTDHPACLSASSGDVGER